MPALRNSLEQLQARPARQHQIEDDRVELLPAGQFQSALALFGPHATVSGFGKSLAQSLANHRIVFDDQQFHEFSSCASSPLESIQTGSH